MLLLACPRARPVGKQSVCAFADRNHSTITCILYLILFYLYIDQPSTDLLIYSQIEALKNTLSPPHSIVKGLG